MQRFGSRVLLLKLMSAVPTRLLNGLEAVTAFLFCSQQDRPEIANMMAGGTSEYTALGDEDLPVQVLPHVKPQALIVVADGSDELETLALSDVLIRGGLHVTIGSVGRVKNNIIMGNYGLRIQAEKSIEECSFENFELIVLPGVRS